MTSTKASYWIAIFGVSLLGMLTAALVGSRAAREAEASAKAEAPRGDIPVVDPFFMLSGALLADGFDGPELDKTLWSRPGWLRNNHETIGVKVEKGQLVISGLSRPVKQSHQYAGVISNYFRETDVVLAAEMQVRTPIKGEGRIQHMVHLCSGDYPDFCTEIIFGKIAAVEPPRWHTAHVAR